jgi:uncharacterized protein YjdB
MLPSAGNLYFFYNSDKNNNLYSVDNNGVFTLMCVIDTDDCCGCDLTSAWLCGLNDALNNGLITGAQYEAALALGFQVNSTNTGSGNCTTFTSTTRQVPTSVVVVPSTGTVAHGLTFQVAASVSPAGAYPGVFWVSSDITKATVDQTGLVTTTAAGSVNIIAYSLLNSAISAECVLTIT